MRFFKFKRLKIVEQIGIVFLFAVLIPMTVSGFIINNVNQQSMRYQLRESAVLIANMVSDEIDFFTNTVNGNLEQIAFSLKYIPSIRQKQNYLKSISSTFDHCEKIEIVNSKENLEKIHTENANLNKATVSVPLDDRSFLVATYTLETLQDEIFQSLKDDRRQIYVMTNDGKLIASHNYTDSVFKETIDLLPQKMRVDTPVIFGDVKNQPIVYVHKKDPAITIIVNTTAKVTQTAINENRAKIILSRKDIKNPNIEQAVKDLEKALEQDEKFLDALFAMAAAHKKLGNYKTALEYLEKLLQIEPEAVNARAFKKLLLQKYL